MVIVFAVCYPVFCYTQETRLPVLVQFSRYLMKYYLKTKRRCGRCQGCARHCAYCINHINLTDGPARFISRGHRGVLSYWSSMAVIRPSTGNVHLSFQSDLYYPYYYTYYTLLLFHPVRTGGIVLVRAPPRISPCRIWRTPTGHFIFIYTQSDDQLCWPV